MVDVSPRRHRREILVGRTDLVRAPIQVASIQGDTAVLSDGPAPGTEVVTVGGEELLGTEFAIEGE